MPFDLGLDSDGDLPLYGWRITGAELVAQRVKIRLGTHLGEDVRNGTVGLPYVEWLSRKPVPVEAIVARLRREVRETRGVLSVSEWTGSLNTSTRTLSITGKALVADGELLDITVRPVTSGAVNPYPATVLVRPRAIVVAPTAS